MPSAGRAPADSVHGGGRCVRRRESCWLVTKREQRSGSSRRTRRASGRPQDNEGILPVLAKAVREVETAVDRGQVTATQHARFQAVALLARAERTRVRAEASL